jgi:hypothetical protein
VHTHTHTQLHTHETHNLFPPTPTAFRGVYNPITLGGKLVVDGVLVSAHSDWFLEGRVPESWLAAAPAAYQAALAPARALYRALGADAVRSLDAAVDLGQTFGQGGLAAYARGVSFVAAAAVKGAAAAAAAAAGGGGAASPARAA